MTYFPPTSAAIQKSLGNFCAWSEFLIPGSLGSVTKDQNHQKWRFTWSQMRDPGSICLIGWKQCCINWLHAGGAREGSHQPVIYTVQVIDVHARQKSDWVPINKVHHTDHTPVGSEGEKSESIFREVIYLEYYLKSHYKDSVNLNR